MAKFELTKTIEGVKLNPRTMRPVGPQRHTLPFGAVLENVQPSGNVYAFFYLGEPYQCDQMDIASALREIP